MKHFFIILLASFIGLLVGCASKPTTSVRYSEQDKETEIIQSIINKKIITCDEYQPCRWYGDTRCFVDTDRTDFTIKIVNPSDKALYLQFMTSGGIGNTKDYRVRRWFYAVLNPGETGLYNIFDFISLKEDGIDICFWNFDEDCYEHLWCWSRYHFEEIIKNHSLEILYGTVHKDDGICKYEYNFVEPFECEFNMEWKHEFYSWIDDKFTFTTYEKGEKNKNN